MDFKLNREIFTAAEAMQDNSYEQAIEQDMLLPDYYPDIFRVLKCRLMPRIVSHSINGDKLTYELLAVVKILYLSEGSDKLNSIEQRLTFTKTCDIPSGLKNPMVTATPKTDYINCRVVNQRRLDLRGAVSVRIRITAEKAKSAVCDISGDGIQLYTEAVTYPTSRLYASKRVTIVEEMELSETKPHISSIIRTSCEAQVQEQKIVSGKLVIKGEAQVCMLYSSDTEEASSLETMRFSIPFSQICDLEGLTEGYELFCDIISSGCDILVKGENMRTIECELVLLLNVRAIRFETSELVTDVYSTALECTPGFSQEKIECVPVKLCETHSQSATLTCQDGNISSVCDAFSSVSAVSARYSPDKNACIVSGNITFTAIGRNDSGIPIYLETDCAFEHKIDSECVTDECTVTPAVSVASCTYNLVDDNSVEIKTELSICGYVVKYITKTLVTSAELSDEPCDKSDVGAVTLYFAKSGERVWDIAKRYHISRNAVMSENELSCDLVSEDRMLLIPDID